MTAQEPPHDDDDVGRDAPALAGTDPGAEPGSAESSAESSAADSRADPVADPSGPATTCEPAPETAPPLPALLEALLLVTDEPVPVTTLAAVTGSDPAQVTAVLTRLAADYEAHARGFELRPVSGGWRLYTRADCAAYVERFLLDGQSARLTQAALETLAVIAYRQPVTRGRVSAVRGVNVDGVVRTLSARGLITEAGQDADSSGTLFRTTPLFLERLGIRSLDDLPALAPLLPDLSEFEDGSTSL